MGVDLASLVSLLTDRVRHPGVVMLVDALLKSWLRAPVAAAPSVSPLPLPEANPLDVALSRLRGYPKIAVVALGVTGLAWYCWSRLSKHQGPN
jgi:drug/metabolite transporter (DMT)-like permease